MKKEGKWLAFDSSGAALSAGLFEDGRKITDRRFDAFTRHSETLMPALVEMLREAAVSFRDLGGIAVGLGPGSFTGLRVGVTTAKVMAYSLGTKLIGISSLEAIALNSTQDGRVAVSLDARRAQVYAALYLKKGNTLKVLKAPHLSASGVFLKKNGTAEIVGDGASVSAANIYESARSRIASGKFSDPFMLEPLYLYARDCNVTLKRK